MRTRITEMLGIRYPILQGGMRGVARAELAAAVGNAGGMGFISAHTQPTPRDLVAEIRRAKALTDQPLGVNLTILPAYSGLDYDGYVAAVIDEGIAAVETAGGNPAKYIDRLRNAGVRIVHKCVTVRHALKAASLGVDAVSIDGFECAGHPGDDDVPALVLVPVVAAKLEIPVVACGGFADGRGLVAALSLGAEGINMGTRFMLTRESPINPGLKQRLIQLTERDTVIVGRSVGDATRVMRSDIAQRALELEKRGGASHEEIDALVGTKGWLDVMDSGDLSRGAVPIGMSVGLSDDVPSCAELIARIVAEARDIVTTRLARAMAG